MALVVIDDSSLYANASAIRSKLGVQDLFKPSQMASAIAAIPTGGGSSESVTYQPGEYFGSPEGSIISSLSVTIDDYIGEKAVIIVMHRDNIVLSDNGFSLVSKTLSGDSDRSVNQWISIYEKVLTSASSSSVTITQESSVRMCACTFYFDASVEIGEPTIQMPDSLVAGNPTIFSISPMQNPTLVVLSLYWSNPSSHTETLKPSMPVLPQSFYGRVVTEQCRMSAFVSYKTISNITINASAIIATGQEHDNCVMKFPLTLS